MELTGSVAGIINLLGGGSDVIITPLLLEGVPIAKITVDNTDFYIYAPEGGSDINVTPTLQAGTKIGDITIGENTVSLYAPNPTSVSVSQNVTEGTQICSITVNGVTTNLFAPESGDDVNYSTEEQIVGRWVDGRPIYKKTFIRNVTLPSGTWITTGDSINNAQVIKSESCKLDSISDSILTWAETGEDGHIELINIRNTGTINITHYTLWYLKTTDIIP